VKHISLLIDEENASAFLKAVNRGPETMAFALAAMFAARHDHIGMPQQAYDTLTDLTPCIGPGTQRLLEVTLRRLEQRGATSSGYRESRGAEAEVARMQSRGDLLFAPMPEWISDAARREAEYQTRVALGEHPIRTLLSGDDSEEADHADDETR
jgi:hypothetical protein